MDVCRKFQGHLRPSPFIFFLFFFFLVVVFHKPGSRVSFPSSGTTTLVGTCSTRSGSRGRSRSPEMSSQPRAVDFARLTLEPTSSRSVSDHKLSRKSSLKSRQLRYFEIPPFWSRVNRSVSQSSKLFRQ